MRFLAILLILISCSTATKKAPGPSTRSIASLAELELDNESEELALCYTYSQNSCYQIHKDNVYGYQSCMVEASSSCSSDYNKTSYVNTLNENKKVVSSKKFKFPSFSVSSIKKITKFVKKVTEIRSNIKKNAGRGLEKGKEVTLDLMHGFGVGYDESLFAGVGINYTGEAIVHKRKLGLFCAPGVMFTTDVGLAAGFSAIKSLSCKNNSNYSGAFLTTGFGVSAEVFALPVSVGAEYSFGIKSREFLSNLVNEKAKGNFSLKGLANDHLRFLGIPFKELAERLKTRKKIFSALSLLRVNSALIREDKVTERIDERLKKNQLVLSKKKITFKNFSLGNVIKNLMANKGFLYLLDKYELNNFKIFVRELHKNLTGCDSVTGVAAVSLSVSPINLTIALNKYHMLQQISLDKWISFKGVGSLLLLNPFLMPKQMAKEMGQIRDLILNYNTKVRRVCRIDGLHDIYKDGQYLHKLLQKK